MMFSVFFLLSQLLGCWAVHDPSGQKHALFPSLELPRYDLLGRSPVSRRGKATSECRVSFLHLLFPRVVAQARRVSFLRAPRASVFVQLGQAGQFNRRDQRRRASHQNALKESERANEDSDEKLREELGSFLDESLTVKRWELPLAAKTESGGIAGHALEPFTSAPTPENSFLKSVCSISPNEMIARFTQRAPGRVQDAARGTILSLLGTAPMFALETTLLFSGEKLASLIFQLLMTGYTLKNAEYRYSLNKLMGTSLSQDSSYDSSPGIQKSVPNNQNFLVDPRLIEGSATRRIEEGEAVASELMVYINRLKSENAKLRRDFKALKVLSKPSKKDDLLGYVKGLSDVQLRSLTENISDDVIVAMKSLTSLVVDGLVGMRNLGADGVWQQTATTIAQLALWQLAAGYHLREKEVRRDILEALNK